MQRINPLAFALASGCIASATLANDTQSLKGNTMPAGNMIGHIYFNAMTGERIATSFADGIRPVDGFDPSKILWQADNNLPCADFGQTSGTSLVVDAPNGEFGFESVEGNTLLDWGDIESDTQIDCLQLNYYSALGDTDTNSDGIGDGVEGFAAVWAFFDADNGFDNCYSRTGLVGFTVFGLSGEPDGAGTFGGYTLTLDLSNSFGSSLAFEIGDTDSSTHANNNPMINADSNSDGFGDADLDKDGFVDFSYAVQYIQPGRQDVDNADGDDDTQTGIDGVYSDDQLTAIGLAANYGTTVDNGDGTYSIIPDAGPNALGSEDAYDVFDITGFYTGTLSMGGFTCLDPTDGTINAWSQIGLIMYGPDRDGCGDLGCPSDFISDGVLDMFDVFEFIRLFNIQNQCADLIYDDIWNAFDVFEFISLFNAGCP